MRKIKKMKELEEDYFGKVLEKTFNVDEDVDYIYNRVFKKFIEDFQKNKYEVFPRVIIKSSELKSDDARMAHQINPIEIICEINRREPPHYNMKTKTILITPNTSALSLIVDYNFDYVRIKDLLGSQEFIRLRNEITEHRLKVTIAHELSHWIDDSLHNNKLTKLADLSDKDRQKILQFGANFSEFEIEAQIHGIKQLKRQTKDWDEITLQDVFNKYPSLTLIAKNMYQQYGKEILLIWLKNLVKRMNREHLLGRNMRLEDVYDYILGSKYKI